MLDLGKRFCESRITPICLSGGRAVPGLEARHPGNNGTICFPKFLASWALLEKPRITSHFCSLGLALDCPLDAHLGDAADSF